MSATAGDKELKNEFQPWQCIENILFSIAETLIS